MHDASNIESVTFDRPKTWEIAIEADGVACWEVPAHEEIVNNPIGFDSMTTLKQV